MPLLIQVIITLLLLCLIFSLCYWCVGLIANVLPLPFRPQFTAILYVLLAILAICCLLDIIGVFGGRHLLAPWH